MKIREITARATVGCWISKPCLSSGERKQRGNMFIMNDLEKYRAKQATKKQLKDSSWELQSFESANDLELMVYCYDHFNSGLSSMAGIRDVDIKALDKYRHSMEAICSSVEAAFNDYSKATAKTQGKKSELLGSVLGLYAVNTRTFKKLIEQPLKENQYRHFIVLLYRGANSTLTSLRPFSLVSDQMVLTPEQVKTYSQDVIRRDEKKNSGFFNFKPVSNI